MKDAEVVKTEASFFVPKRKGVMPMIVLKVLLSNFFIIITREMSNFIMKGQPFLVHFGIDLSEAV